MKSIKFTRSGLYFFLNFFHFVPGLACFEARQGQRVNVYVHARPRTRAYTQRREQRRKEKKPGFIEQHKVSTGLSIHLSTMRRFQSQSLFRQPKSFCGWSRQKYDNDVSLQKCSASTERDRERDRGRESSRWKRLRLIHPTASINLQAD